MSRFIKLSSVEARPDYTLILTFENGERKVFDFKPNLEFEIYAPLKNPTLFLAAQTKPGAVVWNEDIDIASEALYCNGVSIQ